MGDPKKKSKWPKRFLLLPAYGLGFLAWLGGFHCLEEDSRGQWRLVPGKLWRHLIKVFLWTLELALLYHLAGYYRAWILAASGQEIAMAFLVKSVVFLYIKVFWPRVFPEILPGMHVFFCPQCFQTQTFRFQPVSFQWGLGVTYLCRYCSCFVDGWGKQVFYPKKLSILKNYKLFLRSLVPALLILVFSLLVSVKIFEIL